jgi:S1-C subfamily serine protease
VFKLLSILSLFVLAVGCNPSDSKIRSSVVKLSSKKGSCSGTQIEAPSGKKYILTAAHCLPIAVDNIMPVQTEDGGSYFSRVIQEDPASDLLLLEAAPGVPTIKIAKELNRFESLNAFTHGHAYPTYKTSGVYIGEDIAQAMDSVIESDADRARCVGKRKIESIDFFGLAQIEVCILSMVESVSTVKVSPGSSGGLVANERGEMIGVVSMGSADYSFLVTLKDIQNFLSPR